MRNPLGQVFGETIISTKGRQTPHNVNKAANFRDRLFVFYLLSFTALFLIILQLANLTIIRGDYYNKLSQENRIREKIYPAPRGLIVDRKAEILVGNRPAVVALSDCGNKKCYIKISHGEALALEAKNKESTLTLETRRDYIDGEAFSHLLGMVGEVTSDEIGKMHCGKPISYLDELGRGGVEEAFDCILLGTYGKELIETDALGKEMRVLSKISPKPGEKLTLSIDRKLQLVAKEAMEGKKGAVVAHIPQTGEILILYSSPSYDLNKFTESISEEQYKELLENPSFPLFNRAISGNYPPGSAFKPIVAAASLEEKVIDKSTQIDDVGVIIIGPFSFGNWYFNQYGKKEGLLNVVTALKRSNDIFFYKIGEALGIEKIASWAKKFKFGERLGIEISGEGKGLIPDTSWKEKTKGEKWFLGDTYHVAIGQGNLLVTPLQIAFAVGSFANNGVICKPTILKRDSCEPLTSKLLSSETIQIVKEGMIEACSAGGTAYPLFGFTVSGREIRVACKTGTAEYGDSEDKTHAWFTAFAPAKNPQLSVTVLVEEGGEGSSEAAPIAKKIFEEWFK